jgi:hypothetical protein
MWIRPIATLPWDGTWLGALGISLLVAILILALSAPRPQRPAVRRNPERERTEAVATVFGGFFWLMIASLVVALVLGSIV